MNKEELLIKKGCEVAEKLRKMYPNVECALEYEGNAWKLLVMARLSAQCTDKRVNEVCRTLFSEFPDCSAMAKAPLSEIEDVVRPCGLHRGKAKSIKEFSEIIIKDYGGNVPDDMESLLSLPGVGRKTANLVMGDIWKKGGIVADTHCMRICARLGFFEEGKKDPLLTERIMDKYIKKEEQTDFCHRIVRFGRDVCTARSPSCEKCALSAFCEKNRKDITVNGG